MLLDIFPEPDINLMQGDCLEVMRDMDACSIDTIITDPPYALKFMGKGWDKVLPPVDVWKECLRVAKPGAMLMAFGGTRTYHRLTCAIEDAGWEIKDCVMWVYGSGFPKSHNIGKNIEKQKVGGIKNLKQIGTKKGIKVETGTQGFSYSKEYVAGKSMGGRQISGDVPVYEITNEWGGYGTALKPAYEPIVLAMKPLDGTFAQNAIKWGVGGLWIDGGRVGTDIENDPNFRKNPTKSKGLNSCFGIGDVSYGRGCKAEGRWPANLIHDGSDEVVGLFPETKSGGGNKANKQPTNNTQVVPTIDNTDWKPDSGSAARFFYCAKASRSERGEGNTHSTVKPLALMEYLCKLTRMPDGGTVLDPFMGSGTTGIACKKLGRNFIGIDLNPEYVEIAHNRLNLPNPHQGIG